MALCAQCAVHIVCDRDSSYHFALFLVWIASKLRREDCKKDCKENGGKGGQCGRLSGGIKGQAVGDQG